MGQRGSLWKSGGAAGELNIDRIIELQGGREADDALVVDFLGQTGDFVEAVEALRRLAAGLNHAGKMWQALAIQRPRRTSVHFRRQLAQHRHIVAGLELGRQDQRLGGHLVERIFKLGDSIGRVDIDQDQACLGGGVLGDHPFRVVRRPDPDPVPRLQPEG